MKALDGHAAALVAFNLQPARWAHRSWWPAALRAPAARPALAQPALSQWLAQQHGLQAPPCWQLHGPIERSFLASDAALHRLCLELGLALQRDALARQIDGSLQRALQALPGLDAQAWQRVLLHTPAGLGGSAARELHALLRAPRRAAARLQRQGAALLLGLLEPGALAARARLRFARSLRPLGADEGAPLRAARLAFVQQRVSAMEQEGAWPCMC